MRYRGQAAILAAATMLAAQPAQAATIVVNHVLDPADIGPDIAQESLATPFTAGVGDTIEYHLTFTTGSATVVDEPYLWFLSLTSSGPAMVDANISWTFLSPSANLIGGPFLFSEQSSYSHIGATMWSPTYRLDNDPITFGGIDLIIEIVGVQDLDFDPFEPSADPRDYYSIALFKPGRPLAAVPEPASWAMMIGGLAVVGGALRGRRRVAVRFA